MKTKFGLVTATSSAKICLQANDKRKSWTILNSSDSETAYISHTQLGVADSYGRFVIYPKMSITYSIPEDTPQDEVWILRGGSSNFNVFTAEQHKKTVKGKRNI